MSPTKIILIATICIIILISPLLFIYFLHPTILGRYTGLVENIIAGVISGLLITWLLDIILRRRQQISQEKVARIGLTETSQTINRMIALFGTIFKASSDGKIPSTIDELFDAEAANLLSLHLDINSHAPVISDISWQDHITMKSGTILDELISIQDRYQVYFPENVLIALGTLRNNPLLNIFRQLNKGSQLDKQEKISRPVINFVPIEKLVFLMNDILKCIKTVQIESIKYKALKIPKFPSFDFRDNVAPKVGSARFNGNPGVAFIISEITVSN